MSLHQAHNFKGKELSLGKCGEYYAIFTLSKQGYTVYGSDQGLPYDIIVDVEGTLLRGQVKSTWGTGDYGKSKSVYRFGTRSGKGGKRTKALMCDFYAFVAIHDEKIGFMASDELISSINPGIVKQTFEFRSQDILYPSRTYTNGTVSNLSVRNIEDFSDFSRIINSMKEKYNARISINFS